VQRFSVRANYPAGDPTLGQYIKVILKNSSHKAIERVLSDQLGDSIR